MRTFSSLLLVLALSGCQPQTDADDLRLLASDPRCASAPTTARLSTADATWLQHAGITMGLVSGSVPAEAYTTRQTADGYLVRGALATLLLTLTGLALGALATAFAFALFRRRPTARWPDRLGHTLTQTVDRIRALGVSQDPLIQHLVTRFDLALGDATRTAARLVSEARTLEGRDTTPTVAHRDSLVRRLERLVARVERLHLQLLAWQERALQLEDAAVEAQVARTLEELAAATEAA